MLSLIRHKKRLSVSAHRRKSATQVPRKLFRHETDDVFRHTNNETSQNTAHTRVHHASRRTDERAIYANV